MTTHQGTPTRGATRPVPPGASPRAAALARRLLSPIERFLHVEAASGVVLLIAAALAVFAANSRWAEAYHHALEAPVGLRLASLQVERPVHFWINDGLMTIFFFVVGLEIRREVHHGELSNPRRAAVPGLAALGGMIAPALIFLAIAGGDAASRRGWGVPMATDIAFAVGVLTLLGKRVPHALRVLLLALAIIDDIGSIIVIAIFYSNGLSGSGLLLAAGGLGGVVLLQRTGVRNPALYVVPGFVVWLGTLQSGIHPTIAGVVIGLMTPARSWYAAGDLVDAARGAADELERRLAESGGRESAIVADAARLDAVHREVQSPAARLQGLLHPWVAFGIMPLFALANAGVSVGSASGAHARLVLAIGAGLLVGKPLGILVACALGRRLLGLHLPRGVGARELVVLGLVAGIGFTMALFVAALAFGPSPELEASKLAILGASAAAILIGLALGRLLLGERRASEGAASATEAEQSDDV